MFLEILCFTLVGILVGTLTGLIPGIHVNSVCITLPGLSSLFIAYHIHEHAIVSFIISMAITHTILDFIPSIFLGAPEDSTALSVLPGHRLLLQGKGLEALFLTIIGGVGVIVLLVLLTPLLLMLLPLVYNTIEIYIHWILIAIVLVMVITERGLKKGWAVLIFLLSGILGLIVLNSSIISPTFVFFPLFTGLFGISTLMISLKNETMIPPQEPWVGKIDGNLVSTGVVKSFLSGLLVGTLPGVGAAQATVLAQEITRKRDPREFLISVGGINTAVAVFSILSLATIGNPRSGVAVVISKILPNFGQNEIIMLISCALIAVGISAVLALNIGKRGLDLLQKIPYTKLSVITIAFLILLVAVLTNWLGLLVLFTSTAIGLIAPLSGVKRSHCMGVLLLHVILFYSGF